MIPRPCIRCGDLIPSGSRCNACQPPKQHQHYERGTRGRTATDWRWRKISQHLRRASPFCEWCGTNDDLTTDHIIPVTENPALVYAPQNLRVLCRPCNSRRGTTVTDTERQHVTDTLNNRRPRAM